MRYCGECGSSLGVESLYTLRCPSCGASVESNSSLAGMQDPALLENPTRVALGHPVADAPKDTPGHLSRQNAPRPRRVLWTLGLLAAALLLLAGGTVLVLSRLEKRVTTTHLTTTGIRISDTDSTSGRTPQGGSGASTVGSGPGGQPATVTANPSQTGAATQSPISGASPTVGATVTVGPAPTSTPTPAYLSVYPTTFSGGLCVNLKPLAITISNPGGKLLVWTAKANNYSVSPPGGSIDAGLSEQVTVSGILLSGTVTISAPGAENSPVQVHINCLV
jgi:hypothetical protein